VREETNIPSKNDPMDSPCTLNQSEIVQFLLGMGIEVLKLEDVKVEWSHGKHRAPLHVWTKKHGELKVRKFPTEHDLSTYFDLRQSVQGFPMPDIVARSSQHIAEKWIQGQTLDRRDVDPQLLYELGEMFGALAVQHCSLQNEEEKWRSATSLESKLVANLDELHATGCFDLATRNRLLERARSNMPTLVECGFVHLDIQPQNIIISEHGPCVIDNEALCIGPLDFGLARIWGLWPMSPLQRGRFLDGYSKHRSAKSFILHELFWAIYSLSGSLLHRIKNHLPSQNYLDALIEISEGELPFTWSESKRTKMKVLGNRPIRLAFLVDYLAIGGQERVCYELLRALDQRSFRPYLFAFRGGAMVPLFRELGIPMMIGSDRDPLAVKEWTPLDAKEKADYDERLTQALKDNQIDATMVFSWKTAPTVLKNAGIPVSIDKLDGPALIGKVKDKSGFRWIVAESETLRRQVASRQKEYGFSDSNLATIHSCIDLKSFDPTRWDRDKEREKLGLDQNAFVVGFVGRLMEGKNIDFLVRAFAKAMPRLKQSSQRCVLLICGPDVGALPQILAEVQNHSLQEHFCYVPPTENVAKVMCTLDAFAMSSLSEGLPTVILEAMAMGLPIISTATGSIPEVVYENGLICDLGDLESFSNYIVQLARFPEKRQRMGELSRRIAARFTSRHAIGRYEELLIDGLVELQVDVARKLSASSPAQ
jgi:glycosyltransferase involved in cell wall biosynthesis/thiamine kinase-like enzyme